jgi:hypothetical protein
MKKKIFILSMILFIIFQFMFKVPLSSDAVEIIGFILGQYTFALIISIFVIITASIINKSKSVKAINTAKDIKQSVISNIDSHELKINESSEKN